MTFNSEDESRLDIYSDNISEELWEMFVDPELMSTVDSVFKQALEKHIEAVEEKLKTVKQLYKLIQKTRSEV